MESPKISPFTDDDVEHMKLKEFNINRWARIELFDIDKDCSLKEFVEEKGLTYKKGCAFYEFTNDVESISEDKEIIFMSNVSRTLSFSLFSRNFVL